jgi:Xaa-Pro aminopeptidase
MNKEVIEKRIKAIRSRLNKNRINCLVITKPANVTYATGFLGDDSWAIIADRVYLITDSRYTEQSQNQCPHCKIIQRTDSLPKTVAKLIKRLKSVKTVTVEKSASLADFELLKKNVKTRLKTAANLIETIRSCKDNSEIAAIKAAAQIAAKALKQTLGYIKAGITENELAGLLNLQIRKLGATNSFDTIVAFGPNASCPHHQPSRRKLKKKDTILIDFGVKYKGYCCDITRCFAIGRPSAFYKKVYDAVQQAQTAAIKMIKAGVEISKVDATARKVITDSNLPIYGHGTGHGLGLEVHELPVIKPAYPKARPSGRPKSKDKLKAGQIITIEPGVYIPGRLGIRIEDDILITKTGCEILTPPQFGAGLTHNCSYSPSVRVKNAKYSFDRQAQ